MKQHICERLDDQGHFPFLAVAPMFPGCVYQKLLITDDAAPKRLGRLANECDLDAVQCTFRHITIGKTARTLPVPEAESDPRPLPDLLKGIVETS
ncbi:MULTISPECIES: hypothetical protein [Rhodobacterales]|uniref:hypothetical protein n=1 Tax=Rhodobacterales TaxID=204455 RepID=UPI0011BE74AE|nr:MULTISPECIES: hypothetical protein [Rhodobacterales]MDO6589492.1 hypothetical protein [Yoonia sp. 1_MG-2023]